MDHETKIPAAIKRFRRRELLEGLVVGVAASIAGVATLRIYGADGRPHTIDDKRKARYRAELGEVQTFYRVNRYPGR